VTDAVDTPLVLHPDVDLTPASRLSPELQALVEAGPGDYCVTRPRSRTTTTVVDADVAALLELFREPSSVVDAVLALSERRRREPRELLDRSFAAIASLVQDGVLVPAGSPDAAPLEALLGPGEVIGGAAVVEVVHLLADTEVYRGRDADGTAVAVKITRPGAAPEAVAALANEAAVLARLDGAVTPRLLRAGSRDGRPYLITTWHAGLDLATAAADARAVGGTVGRAELLALVDAVLASYESLHDLGVLHGDVHPRNALVDGAVRVCVLDLGLAVVDGVPWRGPVGGIDLFQAPEQAAAQLAGAPPPPPTAAGEQYALAALVYLLLTGEHTRAFALTRDEMLRQVIEEAPLPFARHGVRGLHRVEAAVRRGLAAEPGARYASVAAFREAIAAAAAQEALEEPPPARSGGATGAPGPGGASGLVRAPRLLEAVLARLRPGGEVFERGLGAPSSSVTYGAAGVAYALLRIARARGDGDLLALADLWAARAAADLDGDGAVWDPEHGIVPEVFGTCSLYHHAPGVHAVRALVAHAQDDPRAHADAIGGYVDSSHTSPKLDLAFGAAGLLTGCALLLDTDPGGDAAAALRGLGGRLLARVSAALGDPAGADDGERLTLLGAAHGWAGVLTAVLRWCEASGTAVPDVVPGRLADLAGLAEPAGRGLRWPRLVGGIVDDSLLSASWCNGAAGHVHLWTLADRVLGGERYDALARGAAWAAYDAAADAPGDLCCGLAGRAYALLELHHRTGEAGWWERARLLAERAAEHPRVQPHRADSLFHGELGIAVLAADVAAGAHAGSSGARMPMVAAEGWRPGT
jgi:serine/threonine-protein kinase